MKLWKVAFVSVKGVIFSSFALEFYLSKGPFLSCKSDSVLLYPHCAQVIAHKMRDWVANDIIQEIHFLNTALNIVCFVYSDCTWVLVRICQIYLFCKSWPAGFNQGCANFGLMFLNPTVLHYRSIGLVGEQWGWPPHSKEREGSTWSGRKKSK